MLTLARKSEKYNRFKISDLYLQMFRFNLRALNRRDLVQFLFSFFAW